MRWLAERLATAFLAGAWEVEELRSRGAQVVVRRHRWLTRLVQRIHAKGDGRGRLRRRWVVHWILEDPSFLRACEYGDLEVDARIWDGRASMQPARGAPATWQVPPIATSGKLAEWLGIRVAELEWFAASGLARRTVSAGSLAHYRYQPINKRHGEIRLLEIPKSRLRELQRQILHRLLDFIPPHEAAHGFRAGRTICTFAAPHVGQPVVIRLDLRNFFPAIRRRRIEAIFLTAGYAEPVAVFLAGLCTHRVGYDVLAALDIPLIERCRLERLYGEPHLPQGAPTSPALSNLVAYRLDCRLAALAASAGASYTRYADDLAFSGGRELSRSARRFQVQVAAIALEEGFEVHGRKSRIMRAGTRQRLVGLTVNRHLNPPRQQFDRLKATLHNCVTHGPMGQNRGDHGDFRAHLAGLVAYHEMINPARGARLRALFDLIKW